MSGGVGRPVEVRGFRGTRQASVYRDLVLPGPAFVHMLEAAERHGLPLLVSLARPGPQELDKAQARGLAEELTRLRTSGELPDLDEDLTSLAELARWCAHARREDGWLRLEWP
jgi:hypothetical protein